MRYPEDALLAIADSIQAGFAPVLTLQLLLPGELNATVKDTMTHSANLDLDHSAVITAAGICSTEQRDESVIAVYPEPHATTVSISTVVLSDHYRTATKIPVLRTDDDQTFLAISRFLFVP